MKNFFNSPVSQFLLVLCLLQGFVSPASGQNVFSGEPVQVVGQFNGYSTTPYGSDYRTTVYRTVTTSGGNPTDGRGQWATTIQVPGGDVSAVNMTGGGGAGFLFISGPSGNRFLNKWAFGGFGQGAINAINNITAFNSGLDMGLNMSTSGYYTFVFNDAGYNSGEYAKYYVGFTSSAPVDIVSVSPTPNGDGTATVNVTTGAALSPQENVYVRYTTGPDFSESGSSSILQVSMAGTSGTATIPTFIAGQTVRFYVFSSTRTLAQLNAHSEVDRTLAALRYNDNGNSNFTYVALPVELTDFRARTVGSSVVLSWETATEHNNSHFNLYRSENSRTWKNIGKVAGAGHSVTPRFYEFTENYLPAGRYFYRLEQVDFNGTSSFSDILTVDLKSKHTDFLLYPNPATGDETWVEFAEMKGTALIRLFDLKGALLREWSCEAEGACRFRLDLAGLPEGNLVLLVEGQDAVLLMR